MSSIDISEAAGVRYLHFGSEWVQGAMRVRKPYDLELAYTREMMAGLLLRDWPQQGPRHALLIGLGAGSLTKFIHHYLPQTRITVVEIDPRVMQAARAHFRLPPADERLNIVIGDGADFVADGRSTRYDYVLVDGFDEHARAGVLDTLPFYVNARARLSPQGLMAVNLFGRSKGFAASFERISTAFDSRALALPSCDSGNVIAYAADGDPIRLSADEARERAEALRTTTGLDLRATVSRMEQANMFSGGVLSL